MKYSALFCCCALLYAEGLRAGELPDFAKVKLPGVIHAAVGVTRRDTPIDAFVTREDAGLGSKKCRILLVGGLDGKRESVDAVLDALTWFYTSDDAAAHRELIAVSAIPCANPDGLLLDKGEENGAGGKPGQSPPTREKYYQSDTNVESQYIGRWRRQHSPDLTFDVRSGGTGLSIASGQPVDAVAPSRLVAIPLPADQAERWLETTEIRLGKASGRELLYELLRLKTVREFRYANSERGKTATKLKSDREFVQATINAYCHKPQQCDYISTVPWLASQRLAEFNFPILFPNIDPLVEKPPRSGAELAGLLFLVEVHRLGSSRAGKEQLKAAADLAFDHDGKPLPEPPFHNQMSDAVFMKAPCSPAQALSSAMTNTSTAASSTRRSFASFASATMGSIDTRRCARRRGDAAMALRRWGWRLCSKIGPSNMRGGRNCSPSSSR